MVTTKEKLDLATWNRKEHFEFFSQLDEPFHSLVANVNVNVARIKSKEINIGFFAYCLHCMLNALHNVSAFKLRIEGEEVFQYSELCVSATLARKDHSFAFTHIPFRQKIEDFNTMFLNEQEAVNNSTGLRLNDKTNQPNSIHVSSIPWVHFTSLSHAMSFKAEDSIPKISFGKFMPVENDLLMPVSCHVHHGLVDGRDIGLFFEYFQNTLNGNSSSDE